jgi:mRNA-degrading endonuclease RelE of RelBE toxin-antitoxin system
MQFRIADTFTDSLAKLTGDEQKAVKTTAFDLQLNPANPGMQFHKLDRARDPNFWSVRVSRDIRLIVHKTRANLLICYVDHHDAAYGWAERRKLETHPKTGAAQLVEIRETVQEIAIPKYVDEERPTPPKPALFVDRTADELLKYGVPEEWLDDVKTATEDSLFEIAPHLPTEAAEALLELATGGTPDIAAPVESAKSFEYPDAQRRFRLMTNVDELRQALDYPWEKWTVYLHPAQRDLVERQYNGPARVAGSAGTGKTVVALHRAAFLANEHRDARLLLTTFSQPLARSLRAKLRQLLSSKPRVFERIEVFSIGEVAGRLYEKRFGKPSIAGEDGHARRRSGSGAGQSLFREFPMDRMERRR